MGVEARVQVRVEGRGVAAEEKAVEASRKGMRSCRPRATEAGVEKITAQVLGAPALAAAPGQVPGLMRQPGLGRSAVAQARG